MTSNKKQPVDVLAVMDASIKFPLATEDRRAQLVEARAAVAESFAALRLAEKTITASLKARGYVPGTCTDGWEQAARDEVAALVPVRAALACIGGAK